MSTRESFDQGYNDQRAGTIDAVRYEGTDGDSRLYREGARAARRDREDADRRAELPLAGPPEPISAPAVTTTPAPVPAPELGQQKTDDAAPAREKAELELEAAPPDLPIPPEDAGEPAPVATDEKKPAANPDEEFALFGRDLFGDAIQQRTDSAIAQRFLVPPFTILNAREGARQERKRAWLSLGIESEVGREKSLTYSMPTKTWDQENMAEEYYGEDAQKANTSIFDPVLCELLYHWFCPVEGRIVDPFSGGSVRGIVASKTRRRYWGSELRAEQVEANRAQAKKLCSALPPEYVIGDSCQTLKTAPEADFIFSCPPYGDLEVYSSDPKDLSAMPWSEFQKSYFEIIALAVSRLKKNRFACFVVGDFRDDAGIYRNFPALTIDAFQKAGAALYNEAILVTSVGSGSMRINRQFPSGRKLVKTHQNVLVFVKGDWKKAAAEIPA